MMGDTSRSPSPTTARPPPSHGRGDREDREDFAPLSSSKDHQDENGDGGDERREEEQVSSSFKGNAHEATEEGERV